LLQENSQEYIKDQKAPLRGQYIEHRLCYKTSKVKMYTLSLPHCSDLFSMAVEYRSQGHNIVCKSKINKIEELT
jgi:hypothetical protein